MKNRAVKSGARGRKPLAAPVRLNRGWTLRIERGLYILQCDALAKLEWLVHGFSTRPGGESVLGERAVLNLGFTAWDERPRVAANRAKFVQAVAAGATAGRKLHRAKDLWTDFATLRQVHSDRVVVASDAAAGNSKVKMPGTLTAAHPEKSSAPAGDALITRLPGKMLGVQTADCVPIVLVDVRRRAVAAIHAGWRGTLARIAVKTLGRMRMEFGTRAQDVIAALGPAIGRCCYEVGPEVAQGFAAQFTHAADWFDGPFAQLAYGEEPLWLPWLTMMPPGHVPPPPRVQLDLRASNRWQLVDAGVPEAQISVSELCTACNPELLFSYRREGQGTGRMMTAVGILPP